MFAISDNMQFDNLGIQFCKVSVEHSKWKQRYACKINIGAMIFLEHIKEWLSLMICTIE